MTVVNLSCYRNRLSWRNRLGRALWQLVWVVFFRLSPVFCNGWRAQLLRMFGAHIGRGCIIRPSCRVWAPWNLRVGDFCWIGDDVDCYTVDRIEMGAHVVVSQYAFLCSASHDIEDPHFGLITAPIRLEDGVWVAARAFVAPGVVVGEGAVVGACAVLTRNLEAWSVAAGNPARVIKKRLIQC